ncbi:glycosyltransferase family 4 protein [Paraburkholderia sp. EG287A]|uniref:glycosyltransferase family 4 protein n=1 Tax=unclassified Paraburkholderia TaxID=2615204 RepID=UPI0034D18DAC
MKMFNVVLSTEPGVGKGGVATVIPMYLEALKRLGDTEFIPTHAGIGIRGKVWPWIRSFQRSSDVVRRHREADIFFHLHPGSGVCILRMLLLAAYLRFGLRQRVIVYLHTPYLERYLRNSFWRAIISSLVKCSDRVIALTSYARQLLEKNGISNNVDVISNPYKIEHPLMERRLSQDGGVLVLAMGRLVEGKGFIETLEAMPRLPSHYRLVIAGDGNLREKIVDLIAKLGLNQRVEMKGWVLGEAKKKLLSTANVFCLPSRIDSFGMSFVEAQVYDLPIVAYSHPPVVEVIRPRGGVFVQSAEPAEIAEAITRANDLNSTIESGIGREWVLTNFGVDRVSRELDLMIKEVYRGAEMDHPIV